MGLFDDQGEKTEQATARKLEKASQRGQFARSAEVQTVFVLTSGLLALTFAWHDGWQRLIGATSYILGHLNGVSLAPAMIHAYISAEPGCSRNARPGHGGDAHWRSVGRWHPESVSHRLGSLGARLEPHQPDPRIETCILDAISCAHGHRNDKTRRDHSLVVLRGQRNSRRPDLFFHGKRGQCWPVHGRGRDEDLHPCHRGADGRCGCRLWLSVLADQPRLDDDQGRDERGSQTIPG